MSTPPRSPRNPAPGRDVVAAAEPNAPPDDGAASRVAGCDSEEKPELSPVRRRVLRHVKRYVVPGLLTLQACGKTEADPVVCDPLPPPTAFGDDPQPTEDAAAPGTATPDGSPSPSPSSRGLSADAGSLSGATTGSGSSDRSGVSASGSATPPTPTSAPLPTAKRPIPRPPPVVCDPLPPPPRNKRGE